ncbi:UNVERIFIED_CONTAM: hypothetical protein Sradi_3692600 [Sesamum radiatum]|uniref:Uncharacterized protein n=1 Tax=Sesamum radiatum TaxID=300843 RepID=A0AAW2PXE6_SESRA
MAEGLVEAMTDCWRWTEAEARRKGRGRLRSKAAREEKANVVKGDPTMGSASEVGFVS